MTAEWTWWVPEGTLAGEPALIVAGRTVDDAGRTAIDRLQTEGFAPARPIGLAPPDLRSDESRYPIGALIELVAGPLAVGGQVPAGGRWRFECSGPGGDAASTPLDDRVDPLLTAARLIAATRETAHRYGCLATVDRVETAPGTPGRIPERVRLWVGASGPEDADLLGLVQELVAMAAEAGTEVSEESWTPSIRLDPGLRDRIAAALGGPGGMPVRSLNAPAAASLTQQGAPAAAIAAGDDGAAVLATVLRRLAS